MASQPLSIPSSSDISLPFSTTIIAPAATSSGATSTTSSSSSRQYLMIPPLPSLSSSVHVHSAPPNILLRSSMDHVLLGLGREYDTLVGIITHFPGQLSVEELRTKLLLHEQRLQHFNLAYHMGVVAEVVIHYLEAGVVVDEVEVHFIEISHNKLPHLSSSRTVGASTSPYHSHSISSSSPSSGLLGAQLSFLICQICGFPGHSALQCTNRFNHDFVANDLP
ncbi:hypothetical protein H5410_043354 [Solanum commersonii]|uniref:Uncharacterized protein n=1 Tax=Solanum commersonii TaxID=4109 RepID=A0A9J5Y009_SOLCO|nr:hypothetical protein H5410_043354 [Solanum commersonii]